VVICPHQGRRKVSQLRSNSGSHQHVKRVFAFDPVRETVLVLWCDQWNGNRLSMGETFLSELEVLEKDGGYGDVKAEVTKRAGYVLTPEPLKVA
jgi:hypothetical protein